MMLKWSSILEKADLMKEIQRNGTKEKEVIQAWESGEIVYIDRQIYIPNNKKLWEQIL